MVGCLMDDSSSESYLQAGASSLKYISSSLFSIPGFLVGFRIKSSSESESLRSPTTPLDFKFCSNLSKPFSPKSRGKQMKLDSCGEVGLAIINSLLEELVPNSEVLDSPSKKNVLFGPQVKTKIPNAHKDTKKSIDSSMKSNSWPNYTISSLSIPKFTNSFPNSKSVFGYRITLDPDPETETDKDKTLTVSASSNPSYSSIDLGRFHDFRCESMSSKTLTDSVVSNYSKGANSLTMKSNSDPIDIDSNRVGSLSAQEIELSEDYTCIISHGPNPKTTHIFGDCILECHTNELQILGDKEKPGIESPQVANGPGVLNLNPSDENLSFSFSHEKNCEEEEDIFIYSSDSNYLEDENEKTSDTSCGSFSSSSFNEDLFALGAPVAL